VFKNGFFPGVTEPGFFIKSYGSPLYLGLLRGESSDDSQSGIYFGVKLRVFPIFPSSDSTTYDSKFVLNSADSLGQGGGVLFSYKNQNLVIIRTYFNANKALQGGAIHIGSVNSGMICQDCM
jgi:hypothetical protein